MYKNATIAKIVKHVKQLQKEPKTPKQLFLCDYYALTPQLICSQFFSLRNWLRFYKILKWLKEKHLN